jgi:ABC-type dipeptide/oligopeptide/nickel transport system ATPase component
VLFATHDHSLLQKRSHRIIVLDDGRCIEVRQGLRGWSERAPSTAESPSPAAAG